MRGFELRAAEDFMTDYAYLKYQLPFIHGSWYFVDGYDGVDSGRSGLDPAQPLKTLLAAYNKCTTGRGDGMCLFSRSTASAVSGYALAAALPWTKYGITMVGVSAPGGFHQRVKISGSAALDLVYLINVSGQNNAFYNIYMINDGDANTALGNLIVSGARNYFNRCHLVDGSNATPAGTALCNAVSMMASETTLDDCIFGDNGTGHAQANAPIQFTTTQQGQNFFNRCKVLSKSDTAGRGAINLVGASVMNGWTQFSDCTFVNFSTAGSAGPTALTSVVIGSTQNDCGIFFHNCGYVGWADWCATAQNGIIADNAVGADTGGKGYEQNPS